MSLGTFDSFDAKRQYLKIRDIGSDINSQKAAVKSYMNETLNQQIRSADALVASKELIEELVGQSHSQNEQLRNIGFALDDINSGIEGLQSTLEYGISEIVWNLELNTEELRGINKKLASPLDNQANEHKKRGEKFFSGGLYEEALESFLEAEKFNKYDFTTHISLGILYLFHFDNKEKAEAHFEKAARYSELDSKYLCSFSLLHLAKIKFDKDEIENAEKISSKAISLSPDYLDAYYLNARYNFFLRNYDEALKKIEYCIIEDHKYALKILQDFDNNEKILNLLNKLFQKIQLENKARLKNLEKSIVLFSDLLSHVKKLNLKDEFINRPQNYLKDLLKRHSRNSYLDERIIKIRLDSFPQYIQKRYKEIEKFLEPHFYELKKEETLETKNYEQEMEYAKNRATSEKSENDRIIIIISILVIATIDILILFSGEINFFPKCLSIIGSIFLFAFIIKVLEPSTNTPQPFVDNLKLKKIRMKLEQISDLRNELYKLRG